MPLSQLPPLDLVLLSHDHYDHLDHRTIQDLAETPVPFVAPLGVGAHLEAWGVDPDRVRELDWWEEIDLFDGEIALTATPAQHFSGRSPTTGNQTLWASFVLEGGGHRVYFGGDSGLMTGFADIGARFRSFDLVMLEIGAYHPAWANVHLGPINALQALEALGGGPLLPIHWGAFDLSTHRWDQPIETLWARADETGARVLTPRLGEPLEPELTTRGGEGWWREVARLHGHDVPTQTREVMTPAPPTD